MFSSLIHVFARRRLGRDLPFIVIDCSLHTTPFPPFTDCINVVQKHCDPSRFSDRFCCQHCKMSWRSRGQAGVFPCHRCENRSKAPKYDGNGTSRSPDKGGARAREDTTNESRANQRSALMDHVCGGASKSVDMTLWR